MSEKRSSPLKPNCPLCQNSFPLSDDVWRKILNKEEYNVLRCAGTERPAKGKYTNFNERGVYHCTACDLPLFDSSAKFACGCGWPAFHSPIDETSIVNKTDHHIGYPRTECLCVKCDSHLGHVFNDAPSNIPTGRRFCINSICLNFKPADAVEAKRNYAIEKSESQWRALLSPEEFGVLREFRTEEPDVNLYVKHFQSGIYSCRGCNQPLFSSSAKMDGVCGWPSFDAPLSENAIEPMYDYDKGYRREGINCSKCGGHLGHRFFDQSPKTGIRFCINSLALHFTPAQK